MADRASSRKLRIPFASFAIAVLGIVMIAVFYRPSGQGALKAHPLPLLAPPAALKHLTLGYAELISDALWLRLIQDIDRPCDLEPATEAGGSRPGACHKSWGFQMLDMITELTPKFRMPYIMGATVLSVAVGDAEGARIIFEKGLREFPNDWSMAYRASYHYLEELHDNQRAAELLVQAGKNGAPFWVFSLASRLLTEEGKAELAKAVLDEAIARDPSLTENPRIQRRLKEVAEALKRQ
jgi:tetratricopeptide (TPR) repeat protein